MRINRPELDLIIMFGNVNAMMENVSIDLLIDHIFPYVGDYQYRFVACVNHLFYNAYTTVFPKKRTSKRCNVIDTIPIAQIYVQEIGTIKSVKQCKIIKEMVLNLAAKYGDMNIAHIFHEYHINIKPIDERAICARAALHGNDRSLQLLRTVHLCQWDGFTCANAALNGHLHVVQYAHNNGCKWDGWTCSNAALHGHLDILEYAHDHGCPWTTHTCSNAALNGYLNVLIYARTNDCPWNEWTCSNAALNGHLDILKYAHTNGCPWNAYTCSYAALNGHLHILKYAHNNGCPWTAHTIINAEENGHYDIVLWARNNGCMERNVRVRYFDLVDLDYNVDSEESFGDDDDDFHDDFAFDTGRQGGHVDDNNNDYDAYDEFMFEQEMLASILRSQNPSGYIND
jgi:hypothetical protein